MDKYEWRPLSDKLPAERDFDPVDGDLDAQYAWNQFGGKSLDEAYAHFIDCPENRQEDFMFMGPAAFLFYFPVVERYLFEFADDETWILGHVLINQLEQAHSVELRRRVAALAKHVRSNLGQCASSKSEQSRIDKPWRKIEELLS